MPYTQADLDWAAQMFGDVEADRRFDEQAQEAAWYDQFNDTSPRLVIASYAVTVAMT